MTAVMIGIDPHKGSHTAVAITAAEQPLAELRVRASAAQAGQLVDWAQAWPERTWAVEGARGLGRLLAQQLVAAGERVLDVQPKLAARVDGRAFYDKKIAEGKTHKEALRALKQRISNAIFARLRADARKAAATAREKGPGGQPGNDTDSSAAGSHPEHRLFGPATPEPATTLRPATPARRKVPAKATSRKTRRSP